MSQVRVHNFSVSLDGFGTGDGQTQEEPFGHAGHRLHEWFIPTRQFQSGVLGQQGGTTGADNAFASTWEDGIGAEIMGRGKYFPRSEQWDDDWQGWWGANPPFHTPVFVMTQHTRPTLEMEGGTTFHFTDGSPEDVLAQAREAAGGGDVRIGGGVSIVRSFLDAGLIDYMHVVVVPIVLGRGERLWDGLEGLEEAYDIEVVSTPSGVTHLTFTRTPAAG